MRFISTCTLELAKARPGLNVENHKLPTLCDYFGIKNQNPHRALGDALATLDLWEVLR